MGQLLQDERGGWGGGGSVGVESQGHHRWPDHNPVEARGRIISVQFSHLQETHGLALFSRMGQVRETKKAASSLAK